jgi:YD repeat-containing protein
MANFFDASALVKYDHDEVGSSAVIRCIQTPDTCHYISRLTAQTETLAGVTTTVGYTYDLAGRLTAVIRNGITVSTYTYDATMVTASITTALRASMMRKTACCNMALPPPPTSRPVNIPKQYRPLDPCLTLNSSLNCQCQPTSAGQCSCTSMFSPACFTHGK